MRIKWAAGILVEMEVSDMNTTTAEKPRISILPELANDPELARAVQEATEYMLDLIEKHRLEPSDRELMWSASPKVPFEFVNAHLHETDRYGSRQANRNLSRKRMLDPVARDVMVSQLLQDVLRQRWFQIGDVIDRGIQELEREEPGDGHTE